MSKSATKSPMLAFVELASKLWLTQALNVAAKLGIADLLAEEPKTVDELAKLTDSHAPSLYRILRTLASVGAFTEVEPRKFALTPVAEYLRTDNPYSFRDQILMHCEQWHWDTTGAMFHAVKNGKPAVNHLFQVDTYWDYLVKNPESQELFDKAMLGAGKNFNERFVNSYDFSPFNKVVDVAGGRGALLSLILRKNPHLKGVLFDLAQTVEEAVPFLEKQGVLDRCERVAGNMFEAVPSGSDLYTLCFIMVDWDDDNAIKILQNVRRAIDKNGKVVIIDSIVPTDEEYSWVKWLDLEAMTIGYGRPRTEAEFTELFAKAGFQLARIVKTGTPCDAIELIPA